MTICLGLIITAFASSARAACSNPSGAKGDIIYNASYNVPQFCDDTNWISMGVSSQGCVGPADCPVPGNICTDTTMFVGCAIGGDMHKMFRSRCNSGQTWNGTSCTGANSTRYWNNGNSTGQTTTGATSYYDGRANTELLVATDSDSGTVGTQPHQAAQYCYDLVESGYSDWYLPAMGEYYAISINGQDTGDRFTSTENSATQAVLLSLSGNGNFGRANKHFSPIFIRCIRRRD